MAGQLDILLKSGIFSWVGASSCIYGDERKHHDKVEENREINFGIKSELSPASKLLTSLRILICIFLFRSGELRRGFSRFTNPGRSPVNFLAMTFSRKAVISLLFSGPVGRDSFLSLHSSLSC